MTILLSFRITSFFCVQPFFFSSFILHPFFFLKCTLNHPVEWMKAFRMQARAAGKGNTGAFAASLHHDVDAVTSVAGSIDEAASDAFVSAIENCAGRVLVTGLGKSGVVARRMAVSLASTGTPSHFVHAAEWTHGDLGSACEGDLVIAFSHSGKTAECVQIVGQLEARGVGFLAVAGVEDSPLVNASDSAIVYTIPLGAEPVGGAPTTSVVAQEVVVNAVVNELISRRGFTEADFKFNHPGGSLGQSLKH